VRSGLTEMVVTSARAGRPTAPATKLPASAPTSARMLGDANRRRKEAPGGTDEAGFIRTEAPRGVKGRSGDAAMADRLRFVTAIETGIERADRLTVPFLRRRGTGLHNGAVTAPPPNASAALVALDAVKVYGRGDTEVRALDGIGVSMERGRFTAIMGPSGSGKSTLLHCLAGLDTLTSGRIWIGDVDITTLDEKRLTLLRRQRVGFIFQSFNLVPTLSAADNITLPLAIAGKPVDREWFNAVADSLSLTPRLKHRPTELSGGQQQRVAAARALLSRPDIIFADEPSGNLDSRASGELLGLLQDAVRRYGQTIVLVTHDANAAVFAERVIFLADGRIVQELTAPTVDGVLSVMKTLGG
jgi:putative ABC transport system ATP-binding protein